MASFYMGTRTTLNPLLDLNFLDKLHHVRVRRTHARVIALNKDEEILEMIEGVVTSGTVNIDGTSAVRRTCNLSMAVKELNIHEYYWGLKTKVEIWVGLENEIDDRYPDIIWFKQGTFVLTSFTTQENLGSYTISLQGKDKMTLLNGDLGGIVTSLTWDFGTVTVTGADGFTSKEKLLLKDIVQAAVHQFAVMPLHKIHINDLDDMGLELMEYRGKDPMYIAIRVDTGELNMTLDKNQTYDGVKVSEVPVYDPLFDLEQVGGAHNQPPTVLTENGIQYRIAKLTYGMTAGYRLTDLTYAGDLILNVGDSITSLLDKIVQMLGEYEYYFDLNGEFWFQRKQVYLQTVWSDVRTNDLHEKWVEPNAFSSAITYSFTDAQLVTSYSNAPRLDNVRNDFSIWGTRKGVTGKELPVHLRFAIDDKPYEYVSYDNVKYTTLSLTEEQQLEEIKNRLNMSKDDLQRAAVIKLLGDQATLYFAVEHIIHNRTNVGGLPSDKWWDINDWAELWMATVGEIPPKTMNNYSHSYAAKGTYDYSQYFSNAEALNNMSRVHLIHIDAQGRVVDTGHSGGCGHPYAQWYESCTGNLQHYSKIANVGDIVYLYDPVLPSEIQLVLDEIIETANNEAIQETMYSSVLKTGLDWRELIYQMAQDYNKHHTEDDFYLTIAHNNPINFPKGITGYEQYYTDLDGFWRELYNPFYEGDYRLIGMSKNKYQKAVDKWYEDVTQPFPYYYGEPLYKQCTTSDVFHVSMQYYEQRIEKLTNTVYYEAVRPGKLQYEANPTLYWYRDTDGQQTIKNCLIEETFIDALYWFKYNTSITYSGHGYLQDNTTHTYSRSNSTTWTDAEFTTAIKNYRENGVIDMTWHKLIKVNFIKCYKSNPIQTYYTYYTIDEATGKEITVSGSKIDRTDYYNNPGKYWRYEGIYHQCSADEPYSTDIDYYVCGQNSDDEVTYQLSRQVSQARYEANPERYYTTDGSRKKVLCYSVKLPDDFNSVLYFDVNIDEERFGLTTVLSKFANAREEAWAPSGTGEFNKDVVTDKLLEWLLQNKMPYAIYGYFAPIVHPKVYDPSIAYYDFNTDAYGENGWADYVTESPETLNFWFDFLDQQGDLSKYSVQAIGNRPKAVNDNNVKSIYFRETPTIIFIDPDKEEAGTKLGYTYVNLPQTDILKLFSLSGQGKSAKTVLDGMLYQYCCCAEQITFNTLPYYHLEPNKRIFVSCPESGITGEYIMTRYSVPLGPQGSMSITATAAVKALY